MWLTSLRIARRLGLALLLCLVCVPAAQASTFAVGAPFMPQTGKSVIGLCITGGGVGCEGRDHTHEVLYGSTDIAIAQNYICGLLAGGQVRCKPERQNAGGAPYWTDDLPKAEAITAGRSHGCALIAGGTVQCWGSSWLGQLGTGGTSPHTAAPVSGLHDAVAVDAGDFHSCALISGGTVECWGAGTHGELGDGRGQNSATPVTVDGLTDAIQVSAGGSHTCALRATSDVVCWGDNTFGQLGDGTQTTRLTPVKVVDLEGRDTFSISAGRNHTCSYGYSTNNYPFSEMQQFGCWGNGSNGQLGFPNVRQSSRPLFDRAGDGGHGSQDVVAGDNATCLADNGWVCFGASSVRASTTYGADSALARKHDGTPTGPVDAVQLDGVTQLSAASRGTCARTTGGAVSCWGSTSGGIGRDIAAALPVPVPGIDGASQTNLADDGGCALISGRARCWFLDVPRAYAERTIGGASPYTDVVDIDRSMDAGRPRGGGCVVRGAGTVWCWERSASESRRFDPIQPVKVDGVSNAAHVTRNAAQVCVLRASGTVACTENAPGDGPVAEPTPVGIGDASAIADGDRFTCALRAAGTVDCWGEGDRGQLGDGAGQRSATPVRVSGLDDAIAISAGGDSACAVRSGGGVRCWGSDDAGQLGDGGGNDHRTPIDVPGISDATGAVAVSWQHACVARIGGKVSCWGIGTTGALGDGPAPSGHAAAHSDVRLTIGTLNPQTTGNYTKPRIIGTVALGARVVCDPGSWTGAPEHPKDGETDRGIAMHPAPWRFGYTWSPVDPTPGSIGQRQQSFVAPGVPTDKPSHVVTQADLDHGLSCTVTADNGWHRASASSSVMHASTPPVRPPGVIAVGDLQVCGISFYGDIRCWGAGRNGESNSGGTWLATQVAAGGRTSCAVPRGNGVICWGFNNYGQVGDGTTKDANTPRAVPGVPTAIQVAVGDRHTCALLQSGRVVCWGLGASGRLGNGGTDNASAPAVVSGLTDAIQISAGRRHTCAVRAGGTVVCWGVGENGRLGNGSTDPQLTPVTVSGLSDAVQVAAGGNHTCAVRAVGSVRCWGDNTHGQVGDGTRTERLTPVPVPAVPSGLAVPPLVVQVSAGGDTSCALLAGGRVSCWGAGDSGRLGDGGSADSSEPRLVPNLTTASAITTGIGGTCARVEPDGEPVCWGISSLAGASNRFPYRYFSAQDSGLLRG